MQRLLDIHTCRKVWGLLSADYLGPVLALLPSHSTEHQMYLMPFLPVPQMAT